MLKRAEPPLHVWSRPVMTVLAAIGFGITSYLTVTHFGNEQVALCDAEGAGCDLVLSSEWAKIFGIPLTIFGALGYLVVAGLAIAPLLWKQESPKQQDRRKRQVAFLLFMVSTAMLVFSGYLIYLIAFVIRTAEGEATFCLYCLSSAVLVTGIWLLNLAGNDWDDVGQLFFVGTLIGVVVLTATVGVYAMQRQFLATNESFAGRLAQHLKVTESQMFGTFWCPHCRDQKQRFGGAAAQIPYVECDPRGENPQVQLCRSQGIEGYPTWKIKGNFYAGDRSLEELAQLSGYQGAR
ncbi:MAG: Vitamin K epoxide reductase [Oscillatoriales cyanobacterium SM2_2_1]|nr:Vitamin K epoxide reductase [Oscillatoriales cyanobacterium SM2_2_1]